MKKIVASVGGAIDMCTNGISDGMVILSSEKPCMLSKTQFADAFGVAGIGSGIVVMAGQGDVSRIEQPNGTEQMWYGLCVRVNLEWPDWEHGIAVCVHKLPEHIHIIWKRYVAPFNLALPPMEFDEARQGFECDGKYNPV